MLDFLSQSKRLRSFARTTRLSWLLVGLLSTFWVLLVSQMAIAHHQSFSNSGNDLGVYTQIIWATGEGKPFYTSLTRETTNFLGHHFVPVVAFLAPFYRLWPDARLLLVAQAILLAAAAFPLFAFADRHLGERYALLVVLAYFLYPALAFIAFFEFHEIALSVLPLMAAGAALLEQKGRATLFWLVLAMGTKEEVALIAIAFGLYALFFQQRGRFGGLLSIGALSWSLFLFGWLMPSLNQLEGNYTFAQRYASLGGTPLEIILTIFTHPMAMMGLLMSEIKQKFVI